MGFFKKLFNMEKEVVKQHSELTPLSPDIYGISGLNGNTQVSDTDLNVSTLGLQIYKKMIHDDQIKPALLLKKLAFLAGGWEIQAVSDEQKDKDFKRFIEFNFEQLQGSLEKTLLEFLSVLEFGYAITEKLFQVSDNPEFSGKIILKAFKSKDPEDFEFIVDKFGNIIPNGLVQLSTDLKLPTNKFLHYAFNSQFGNVYGVSDLKAAYPAWFSKQQIRKGWNIYVERFGVPILTGLYNPGLKARDQSLLKTILDRVQFKTSMVLPKELIDEIKIAETNGTGSDIFEKALSYYDRAMARSILVPDQMGLGGQESVGSLAKAIQQFDVFMLSIHNLQKEIAEHVIKEQIIKPLIDLNFGIQAAYPKFIFKSLEGKDREAIANLWILAVEKGIVMQDLEDQNKFRGLLDFPEKKQQSDMLPTGTPPIKPTIPTQDKPVHPDTGKIPVQEKLPTTLSHDHALNNRALTTFEKKVNFKQLEAGILSAEKKMFTDTQVVLIKQKNILIKSLTKDLKKGVKPGMIKNVSLPSMSLLTQSIKKGLVGNYKTFKAGGKKEISSLKKMAITGEAIVPQEAIDFFAAKSFIVSGTINDQLTAKIKQNLLTGLKEGQTLKTIINNIEDTFKPFTGDPLTDTTLNKPHRLEAIVRTNLNEAYNQGRKDAFSEGVKDGFVIGYFYSAIIDGRQTDICDFLDGKILPVNDSRTDRLIPPNHFNERSIIVPVTRDEAPVDFITDAEFNQALTLRAETNFS